MKLKLALLVLPVLITACAGPRYAMQPAMQPGQTKRHEQGSAAVESSQKHIVTVRQLQSDVGAKERLQFLVAVGNRGQEPFDFSLANVRVELDGKPLKTYSFEERKREIENAAAMMAFAAGLNAASASINTAFPQTTYGTLSGPGGSVNYQLTQFNSATAAAQQSAIQANLASQMQSIEAMNSAQLQGLGAVLRLTTIQAGMAAGGVVMADGFKQPGPHTVRLKVDAGGETHEFEFEVQGKAGK